MQPRVLFILKRRLDYNYDYDNNYGIISVSTGLYNSAQFVSDMLREHGIESRIVVVVDNNDIDREVTAFRPTHVIIEALWVVPEKFNVLSKLHPDVKWVIRFHSEVPFIASEGIAMKWLYGYMQNPNIIIGVNAHRFLREVRNVLASAGYSKNELRRRVCYLPNYYPIVGSTPCKKFNPEKKHIDVGCFGAIRPMKNQLMQAIAALEFADKIGKKLHFHVNVGRVETKGDPVLHNLEGLFHPLKHFGHKLVVHKWTSHDEFIETIKLMDIGMQVSFSETFNIVAADMVVSGIPVVVSREVPWVNVGIANPTDSKDIVESLSLSWRFKGVNVFWNKRGLSKFVKNSKQEWLEFFRKDF